MRVALYVPQIPDENTTPLMGPLYLIAVLEQNGFEGRLFDARIDKHAFRKLLAFSPDIVGVSAVTPGYLGGLRAATKIKEILPSVPIVFGGPHPSSLPEEVVAEPSVNYVLVGENEMGAVALISLVQNSKQNVSFGCNFQRLRPEFAENRTPSGQICPLGDKSDCTRMR